MTALWGRLVVAGWAFAAGSALHLADHLRRGQSSVTEALYVAGTLALVVQVAIVALVVTRHAEAPRWSVLGGFPLAAGFLAAHWLPHWSVLSDPVWEIPSWTWVSWLASAAEVAGALAVALAGLALLRASRAPAPHQPIERPRT